MLHVEKDDSHWFSVKARLVLHIVWTRSLICYQIWYRGCLLRMNDPYWIQVMLSNVKVKLMVFIPNVFCLKSNDPFSLRLPKLVQWLPVENTWSLLNQGYMVKDPGWTVCLDLYRCIFNSQLTNWLELGGNNFCWYQDINKKLNNQILAEMKPYCMEGEGAYILLKYILIFFSFPLFFALFYYFIHRPLNFYQ